MTTGHLATGELAASHLAIGELTTGNLLAAILNREVRPLSGLLLAKLLLLTELALHRLLAELALLRLLELALLSLGELTLLTLGELLAQHLLLHELLLVEDRLHGRLADRLPNLLRVVVLLLINGAVTAAATPRRAGHAFADDRGKHAGASDGGNQ